MFSTPFYSMRGYSYPIAESPAVCLTTNLPKEKDSDILLLQAGDLRHVLFTNYIDAHDRKIDITCTDHDPLNAARNILLVTLILDGKENNELWNIYYHMFLEHKTVFLLKSQARKLLTLAETLDDWKDCEYGFLIKFTDGATFFDVKKMWRSYLTLTDSEVTNTWNKIMRGNCDLTADAHRVSAKPTLVPTLRSSQPINTVEVRDLNQFHGHYWQNGTSEKHPPARKVANPTMASAVAGTIPHPLLNPLFGFHLAPAFIPMDPEGDYKSSGAFDPDTPTVDKAVECAKSQFKTWCDAFHERAPGRVTLRFFAGDPIPFCVALQTARLKEVPNTVHIYHRARDLTALIFDLEEMGPKTFDMINVAHLYDNAGSTMLLCAASTLLKPNSLSVIHTDFHCEPGKVSVEILDGLLGVTSGAPTAALLIGLSPVNYWTGTCPTRFINENDAHRVRASSGPSNSNELGSWRIRTIWKRPIPALESTVTPAPIGIVKFDDDTMARLLFNFYTNMFHIAPDLPTGDVRDAVSIARLRQATEPAYTPASFAMLLSVIKTRVEVDWTNTVSILLERIRRSIADRETNCNFKELEMHMHFYKVYYKQSLDYGVTRFRKTSYPVGKGLKSDSNEELHRWVDKLDVVYVTVIVPKANLKYISDFKAHKIKKVPLQAVLWGKTKKDGKVIRTTAKFASINYSFGTISTNGQRNTDDYRIRVDEDICGRMGETNMVVTWMAPAALVSFLARFRGYLGVGVRGTTLTHRRYTRCDLHNGANFFEGRFSDTAVVHVSREPPNCRVTGLYSPYIPFGFSPEDITEEREDDPPFQATVQPTLRENSIVSFRCMFDRLSVEVRELLAVKNTVIAVKPLSPYVVEISIGPYKSHVAFPVPLAKEGHAKNVLRVQGRYGANFTPMTEPHTQCADNYTLPCAVDGQVPVPWNIGHLDLDRIPAADPETPLCDQWLIDHLILSLSTREQHQTINPNVDILENQASRNGLKGIVYSIMISAATGNKLSPAERAVVVGGPNNGIRFVIYPMRLCFDLHNGTLVADTIVFDLHDQVPDDIIELIIEGVAPQSASNKEDNIFSWALPALVERCRSWPHTDECEYRTKGLPLAGDEGDPVLCQCGDGVFPPDYGNDITHWKKLRQYGVRAAISPIFFSAFAEYLPNNDFVSASPFSHGQSIRRACAVCRKGQGRDNLRTCHDCHNVWYCSRGCERSDKKTHAKECPGKSSLFRQD